MGLYVHTHAGTFFASKRASEIVMRCRVDMSTQYNDVSCRWLVTKPIVWSSEVHINSYRLHIPVASELAYRVVALPTPKYVHVNEPVSLSVQIIILPIFHVAL